MYVIKILSASRPHYSSHVSTVEQNVKDKPHIMDLVNDSSFRLEALSTYNAGSHIETESDLDLVIKQVEKFDAADVLNRPDVEKF